MDHGAALVDWRRKGHRGSSTVYLRPSPNGNKIATAACLCMSAYLHAAQPGHIPLNPHLGLSLSLR